jgi:hypothetical protein
MNYSRLSVVLPLSNNWKGSEDPASLVHEQQLSESVSCLFNCCQFFSHGATNEYQILFQIGYKPIETDEIL